MQIKSRIEEEKRKGTESKLEINLNRNLVSTLFRLLSILN